MAQDIEIDLNEGVPAKRSQRKAEEPLLDVASLSDALVVREVGSEGKQLSQNETMPNDRDLINQILGQVQATQAISKLSQTFGVSKLAYVKETKAYRALKGMTPNGLELSGTWTEFCALLGMSDEKANQDIANLKEFGEEALESMTRMGIGYRDLAQYRKLPDDQKTALIEAAKSGDKDQLLDLAESLIEKHLKEKAELTEELKIKDKRMQNLERNLDDAEKNLEVLERAQKRTHKPGDLAYDPRTFEVRHESAALEYGARLHIDAVQSMFNDVVNEPADSEDEHDLRVAAIATAAGAILLRAHALYQSVYAYRGEDAMPVQAKGQYMLTDDEVGALQDSLTIINANYSRKKEDRIAERNADAPPRRGRPAGSKNKVSED